MTAANDPARDRRALVGAARAAIAARLGFPPTAHPDSPLFDLKRGAFVTLTHDRQLRGCVGRVQADRAVRVVVPEMARAAAFEDPRFPPLDPSEFAAIAVEVSLLSLPVAVVSPEEVVVGLHGVIVSAGGRRALLLPQVAVEWNWSREDLLANACRKASLDADAWRRPTTRVEVFTADVYAEETA